MARGDKHGVNFVFEFYDEDSTFPPFLEKVTETGWLYAFILHDKDVFDDGKEKKPHYHAIVHTDNDRSLSSVCSMLGAQERFCQVLKKGDDIADCESYLIYLLHEDKKSISQGKHRYALDELSGPLKEKYRRKLEGKPSKQSENPADILKLLDYIDATEGYLLMSDLIRYAVAEGLYSNLRRSATLVRQVVNEHNDMLRKEVMQDGFSSDVIEFRRIKDMYNFTRNKVAAAGGNPDNVKVNMNLLRQIVESEKAQ